MNPFEIMHNLKEEEIDEYIKHRLSFLKNKEEKRIGLNTEECIYNGFLDEKIDINTIINFKPVGDDVIAKCGSLVVDDPEIYKYLIKCIKECDNPFSAIMAASDKYLSLKDEKRVNYKKLDELRIKFYYFFSIGRGKGLSIKSFHKHYFSLCSEIASVVHNMCKFLGIESDYVVGALNDISHTFNVIYLWGRDDTAILYDGARDYDSLPGIFLLDNQKKKELYSFNKVSFDNSDIEKSYSDLLGQKITSHNQINEYIIYDGLFYEVDGYDLVSSTDGKTLIYHRKEHE